MGNNSLFMVEKSIYLDRWSNVGFVFDLVHIW